MTKWLDRSDARSRFLDGGDSDAATTNEVIDVLFECFLTVIIGKGAATDFNLVLFEVNCDTGRLLVAATTSDRYGSDAVDGCSLRVQKVQDKWYDLLEAEPSDEQFSAGITQHVHDLGMTFREKLVAHLDELEKLCSSQGFTYRVYGADPGISVYEEAFAMPQCKWIE